MGSNPNPTDIDTATLTRQVGALGELLAAWRARRDGDDRTAARRSATHAVETIDEAQHELHRLRRALVAETRRFDDDVMAESEAIIARVSERIAAAAKQQGGAS